MKKSLCVVLSLSLALCLSGCGDSDKDEGMSLPKQQPGFEQIVDKQEPSEIIIGAPADSVGFELNSEDVMSSLGELPPVPPAPEREEQTAIEEQNPEEEETPSKEDEVIDGIFTAPNEETKIPNMGIFLEDD